jgi:hypothetical protein
MMSSQEPGSWPLDGEQAWKNQNEFERSQAIDARLTWQEDYLQGAVLHWRPCRAPQTEWDRDHSEFYWRTIDEPGRANGEHEPDCIHEAYITEGNNGGDYWICPQCFEDFRERFQWVITT